MLSYKSMVERQISLYLYNALTKILRTELKKN